MFVNVALITGNRTSSQPTLNIGWDVAKAESQLWSDKVEVTTILT